MSRRLLTLTCESSGSEGLRDGRLCLQLGRAAPATQCGWSRLARMPWDVRWIIMDGCAQVGIYVNILCKSITESAHISQLHSNRIGGVATMSRNRLAEIQTPQNTSSGSYSGNYEPERGNDFIAGESYEMQRQPGRGFLTQNEFLDQVDCPKRPSGN
jgi:hypothetical protein